MEQKKTEAGEASRGDRIVEALVWQRAGGSGLGRAQGKHTSQGTTRSMQEGSSAGKLASGGEDAWNTKYVALDENV
jgi:hypothetical protein